MASNERTCDASTPIMHYSLPIPTYRVAAMEFEKERPVACILRVG